MDSPCVWEKMGLSGGTVGFFFVSSLEETGIGRLLAGLETGGFVDCGILFRNFKKDKVLATLIEATVHSRLRTVEKLVKITYF